MRSIRIAYPAPNLLLPGNSSTGEPLRLTFTWDAIQGATGYILQVSTLDTFSTKVINKSMAATTYTHTADLLANTTYYWRVRAKGAYGPGAWQTAVFQFTTTP